jgi:hypothetical protein
MYSFLDKQDSQNRSTYATLSDFCKNLIDDLPRLYRLAFLLTGTHADAERCFFATIDDVATADRVFKGWEQSWSKRCLIVNAIHLRFYGSGQASGKSDPWREFGVEAPGHTTINALIGLDPPLQRFVFVMSVLEKYSEHECALLLGCTLRDVVDARVRALYQFSGVDPGVTRTAG